MERRKALAVAAAGALLSASGVVAVASGVLRGADHAAVTDAAASTVAAMPLESTTTLAPVVVTETRDVYDTVVVPSPVTPSTPVASSAAEPAPGTMVTVGASPQLAGSGPTTTTVPPTTSTTRPPGVPADWPADRPIPPMPPGCEQPQLEDNGIWNCDH